ncbi:MAG: GNAT family N-acetyltransferase, partial [Lysobacteraceae bacterium]
QQLVAATQGVQGGGSPLLAADFLAAALDTLGSGDELLAWYEEAGRTLVMTVVAPSGFGRWTTFQPSQAPVGFWLQQGDRSPERFIPGLLRALPGAAVVLGITQCDPMLLPRPGDSARARTLDYIDTARISLAQGFEAYWNGRGKNLRNNLKKQRKRLQAEGCATRLQVSRAPHEMAAAVADYGMLETSGWKAAAGSAVSASDRQGRFYQAMLEAFARRGAARVYRYWIGERLAAMDLCVEGGGCVVVLKTAYDESLGGALSPALLMREEACRDIFEDGGFERIEFYGRVMEWHLRWTDEIRTMYHLNSYRWSGLARLHALAKQA